MKTNRKNEIILFFIWLLIQFFILFFNGIISGGEAEKYINEANLIINQQPLSSPVYFMYLIEILLVFIKIKFSLSFAFIVIIHLILNALALFRFQQFLKKSFNSDKWAFWGSLLLLLCIPYQTYNSLIYTESIFFSLTILFSCFLLSIEQFKLKELTKITLFLIILCLTRPTGIYFVMASFLYVFSKTTKGTPVYIKTAALIIIPSIILFTLNLMMKNGKGVDVLRPFIQEHIICDVPTIKNSNQIAIQSNPGLLNLFEYIFNRPLQFIRLGILKTVAFFGLIRPYYSIQHNIYLGLYFYGIYALILLGIIKRNLKIKNENIFYISLSGIFWLFVIFSCDEWHSRFFLTLTPFLILMSLRSLYELKNKTLV